jgi:HAD superfamily hydrolase (TIGR01490 family)
MKKFAALDIDGTLIRWQLYHSVVDKLHKLGKIHEDDFAKVFQSRLGWKKRQAGATFADYEKTVVGVYEKTLQKIDHKTFMHAAGAAFNEHSDQVYTYTRGLVGELKDKGYKLLAISGSQIEIVEMIAKHWGFDDWVGTVYEVKAGKFTGKVHVASKDKRKVLSGLIAKHGLSLRGSVAVGDSENDIPMLEMVERPIAFNPTKGLARHAKQHGWPIVVERKSVIYKLDYRSGDYILNS